jgi:hypothetical protein
MADRGKWDMEYGIWDMDYGIQNTEYGIWDMEFGIWEKEEISLFHNSIFSICRQRVVQNYPV